MWLRPAWLLESPTPRWATITTVTGPSTSPSSQIRTRGHSPPKGGKASVWTAGPLVRTTGGDAQDAKNIQEIEQQLLLALPVLPVLSALTTDSTGFALLCSALPLPE
ncbi:hypothetical protein NDU88_003628 [Pleurodeles waltl]|uniref:Uncharacterized protein n=1 Tax=Pleurodeles waltl TaxID=8319 RepID=A0AAV7V144_PLEWA|nr:hypothetical protein NDU88_003628 [Pleurodeles waltl]